MDVSGPPSSWFRFHLQKETSNRLGLPEASKSKSQKLLDIVWGVLVHVRLRQLNQMIWHGRFDARLVFSASLHGAGNEHG